MVPGMMHCVGGEGATDRFDAVATLEQWVERGVAPSRIVASHQANGSTDRTRPLCPYPQTAQWKGSGSTDVEENFECVVRSPSTTLRDERDQVRVIDEDAHAAGYVVRGGADVGLNVSESSVRSDENVGGMGSSGSGQYRRLK
jgi:Tannase and feruloyl esterase